jgi:folate-binding Fe-S cluster repair protein YgfZ
MSRRVWLAPHRSLTLATSVTDSVVLSCCVCLAGVTYRGADASKLLQGVVTNDMKRLDGAGSAMYTAFLNSKGRSMFEGHVAVGTDGAFLVDVHSSAAADAVAHLVRHRLRAKVTIEDASQTLAVAAVVPESTDSDLWSVGAR